MMRFRWIAAGLCLVLTAAFASTAAAESRPKPETKKVQGVREWAYKRLNAAHEAIGEERWADALSALQEMRQSDKLNDHERALMWQTYGYVYSSQERYKDAVSAFEQCLAQEGLPEGAVLNTRYNLAQLYLVTEQYQKALDNFEIWLAQVENPTPDAHYMVAMAYMQAERPEDALPHAEQALAKSDAPKEPWLQLVLSLYFEKERYRDAIGILRQLVARFPKKVYWMQLSAAYSQLDDHRQALAVMEIAYEAGHLDKDRELRNLAQLYLFNEVPYEAAKVLAKGIEDGIVEKDEKAWEMLASAWLHAQERDKALQPLEKAAEMADDGELYLRIAHVEVERERWEAARKALRAALQKGGLKDPGTAQLLLGIANASDERWDDAKRAFEAAKKHDNTKHSAAQWLAHLDAELELLEDETVTAPPETGR